MTTQSLPYISDSDRLSQPMGQFQVWCGKFFLYANDKVGWISYGPARYLIDELANLPLRKYLVLYKGQTKTVEASTSLQAQTRGAELYNVPLKHQYRVHTFLAETQHTVDL